MKIYFPTFSRGKSSLPRNTLCHHRDENRTNCMQQQLQLQEEKKIKKEGVTWCGKAEQNWIESSVELKWRVFWSFSWMISIQRRLQWRGKATIDWKCSIFFPPHLFCSCCETTLNRLSFHVQCTLLPIRNTSQRWYKLLLILPKCCCYLIAANIIHTHLKLVFTTRSSAPVSNPNWWE